MKKYENGKKNGYRLVRLCCGTLGAAMVLGGALGASARTPDYPNMSSAFHHSRYYLNLQCLNLTGDGRTDIVMVAMSQLGYHEGNSSRQTHGENRTGYGNCVEYNYRYGRVNQNGNGLTYSYPWCASFVTYCARVAGIDESVLPSGVNCAQWVSRFRAKGCYHTANENYIPQKGDLIFFRTPGSSKTATHVGVVRYTCNGVVYTIEGNLSNQVALAAYDLTDSYVVGYASPDYEEDPATAYTYLLDRYREGNYIIAASSLPVYRRPDGGTKTYTLRRGDLMHIYETVGTWGRTDYGWIHLPDTQPVDVQ